MHSFNVVCVASRNIIPCSTLAWPKPGGVESIAVPFNRGVENRRGNHPEANGVLAIYIRRWSIIRMRLSPSSPVFFYALRARRHKDPRHSSFHRQRKRARGGGGGETRKGAAGHPVEEALSVIRDATGGIVPGKRKRGSVSRWRFRQRHAEIKARRNEARSDFPREKPPRGDVSLRIG